MRRSSAKRYVAEALGTFALVAIGPGAAMVADKTHAFGHAGVALAFGLAVTLIVAGGGHISGAHINPAVTLALWSVGRFEKNDVAPYVFSQCVGAIASSALLVWLLGPVGGYGATVPHLPIAQSFVVEFGYTALLGFVIMAVATDERFPTGAAPYALGATVFAGALVTGPLTGGSFNPARTLGPAVIGNVWTAHWFYWAAPIGGMIAGMHAYDLLRTESAPSPGLVTTGAEGPLDVV